jgi:hypothetical protein
VKELRLRVSTLAAREDGARQQALELADAGVDSFAEPVNPA